MLLVGVKFEEHSWFESREVTFDDISSRGTFEMMSIRRIISQRKRIPAGSNLKVM